MRIWHPPQILQGPMTSSPTWQRRESLESRSSNALLNVWLLLVINYPLCSQVGSFQNSCSCVSFWLLILHWRREKITGKNFLKWRTLSAVREYILETTACSGLGSGWDNVKVVLYVFLHLAFLNTTLSRKNLSGRWTVFLYSHVLPKVKYHWATYHHRCPTEWTLAPVSHDNLFFWICTFLQ